MNNEVTMIYEWEKYFEHDDRELRVVVEIKVWLERSYGADADGNRGMPMHFSEVEDFEVYDCENLITDQTVIDAAEKWFDKYHADDASCEANQEYKES